MKSEEYIRLRCKPAEFTVEEHTIDVAVGTDGDHQDEFLRGDRPKDLMDRCIVTPSVMAAVLNAEYTNAMPLNRISEEFFAWVKERLADTSVMPSGKTAEGLNYCVNNEKYLRVFLTNGNVPMDNSASLSEVFTYPHLSTVRHTGIGFSEKRCG